MGFIKSPTEQIKLAHTYVGRKLVRETDWDQKTDFGIKTLDNGLARMTAHGPVRATGVRHYLHQ